MKSFFEKYSSPTSHLYLSTSSLIIEQFNHFEKHYILYQTDHTSKQHDNLYTSLSILEESVELKLKDYRKVLFKQYECFYRVELYFWPISSKVRVEIIQPYKNNLSNKVTTQPLKTHGDLLYIYLSVPAHSCLNCSTNCTIYS
jgi:hypothetical protein